MGIGHSVVGYNDVPQGAFAGSIYPGEDAAWVSVNGNWTPEPCVGPANNSDRNCNDSPNVEVFGSQEAAVGDAVCRYGRTTNGPHCGVIQAKNQTVIFNGTDTVQHETQTSACAEPGDSGGPFIWNDGNGQAEGQGTLTGGTGNCTSGGTMYFYPLNISLSDFSLTLLTAQPPPPPQSCPASSGTDQGTASTVRWNLTAAPGGASWKVNGDGVDPFLAYSGQYGTASVNGGCLSGHAVANWLQGVCSAQWSVTASVSCKPGPPQ
ncbi:MAG: trypsin-like serine protease [Gammaproteobacteria bacterium]|nr:trypsin-like serine protease [Gammaproteobacteria bacterium]